MTALQLATKLRYFTKQNATTLTDADALILLNDAKDHLSELIATRDLKGNYFILPTQFDLVAGVREYALPIDVLDEIFSVEAAFTNTLDALGNLQYLLGVNDDFSKWGVARTEANIQTYYSSVGSGSIPDSSGSNNGSAFPNFGYEIQRQAIYLLSGAIDSTTIGGATVPLGIRVRYRSYPAALTQLTDNTTDLSLAPSDITFGFPKQFHELWALRASMDWKSQNPGAVPPSQLEALYPTDLEAKLQGLSNPDMSQEIFAAVPGVGGTPDPFGAGNGFML